MKYIKDKVGNNKVLVSFEGGNSDISNKLSLQKSFWLAVASIRLCVQLFSGTP